MGKEYFTIKEYAEIKGVSVQAIYKRCSTSLKPFVEIIDGRRVLRAEALKPISTTSSSKPLNDFQSRRGEGDSLEMILFLKEQIAEKDKQIERLQESADSKDKYIQEQGARLADLVEQSNQLQQNNQILIKMLSGTVEDNNDIIIDNENVDIKKEERQEEKKGLFSKLFK